METEKGEKGSLMWLSVVNMQGGAVGGEGVAGTGQRGQGGQAGWVVVHIRSSSRHQNHPHHRIHPQKEPADTVRRQP